MAAGGAFEHLGLISGLSDLGFPKSFPKPPTKPLSFRLASHFPETTERMRQDLALCLSPRLSFIPLSPCTHACF